MLQLSMTGEYAVRAMLHLASLPPGTVALIAEISRTWETPEAFLRKIMGRLLRGRLVRTIRGNGGGVMLARPAAEITLLHVLEAAEGPLVLNDCLSSPDACHRIPWCPVHTVWCEAQHQLRTVLSSRTLADLARQLPPACTQPAPGANIRHTDHDHH